MDKPSGLQHLMRAMGLDLEGFERQAKETVEALAASFKRIEERLERIERTQMMIVQHNNIAVPHPPDCPCSWCTDKKLTIYNGSTQ